MTATDEKPACAFDRKGDPCIIVIFGAAGDLNKRKLLPALHNLRANRLLPDEFAVVGVARRELSHQVFREQTTREVQALSATTRGPSWIDFAARLYYSYGDFGEGATYERLAAQLIEVEKRHHTAG